MCIFFFFLSFSSLFNVFLARLFKYKVELALVGGTKGPPAGASAAAAFDVVAALALATARFDLSAGRGAPYEWPTATTPGSIISSSSSNRGAAGSSGGSAGAGPGGAGTARLTAAELERCLALVFPGADSGDGDGADGSSAPTQAPSYARLLKP
jgi:hypothetical protein